MGLAASQARLLMLTSRKGDVENGLTNLANQKLSIARQSSQLSQAYSDALSAKTMTWNTTATTSGSTPLNYDLLMTPNATNTSGQYLIADNYGRVMLNDEYASFFGASSTVKSGNNAGNETLPKFLVDMGVATDIASATTLINNEQASSSSSGKSLNTMTTDVNNLLHYAISETGTTSGSYYKDNTLESFRAALNTVSKDISSEIQKITGLTDAQMNYLEGTDQYTKLKYDDNSVSGQTNDNLLSTQFKATMGCSTSTTATQDTLQWAQTSKQALTYGFKYTYTAAMPDGTTATKTSITGQTQRGGYDSTTITNTSSAGVTKTVTKTGLSADAQAVAAFITATGIPAQTTRTVSNDETKSSQYKELEYLVRMQRAVIAAKKTLDFFNNQNQANADYSEISTAISMLLQGGSVTSFGSDVYKPDNVAALLMSGEDNGGAINGDGSTYANYFDFDLNGVWANSSMGASKYTDSNDSKNIFTEDVNDLFGNYTDIRSAREAENPSTTADNAPAYYINLWKAVNTKGWTTSNKALNEGQDNDGAYLQNLLLNGGAYLYKLQDNGSWKIASTSDSNTPINTETDDNAISTAEAQYTAAKDQLTYKENQLDIKSNDLDTERSAISTEMESVKKIIDSNIKVLKMFNSNA